jgi:hypothetical protein
MADLIPTQEDRERQVRVAGEAIWQLVDTLIARGDLEAPAIAIALRAELANLMAHSFDRTKVREADLAGIVQNTAAALLEEIRWHWRGECGTGPGRVH